MRAPGSSPAAISRRSSSPNGWRPIGIDVGSKEEIRGIVDEIAAAGVGIVLITTELEELVSLCDRVLVMFRGEIVGELSGQEVERETILHASACGEIRRKEA